ncbi:MAG: CHAD domain-containing protein, partial [Caulobacteraceae bacterium]
ALDGARDLDVFARDVLAPAAESAPGDAGFLALGESLAAARAEARDAALRATRSARFSTLLLDACAWMEVAVVGAPDPVRQGRGARSLEEFAVGALDRARNQVKRRGRGLRRMAPPRRHKARIEVKRLRYAAEFFGPLFEARAVRKFVSRLEDLQESLGELNDIAVARVLAAAFAASADPSAALAAGRAVGRREAAEGALLRDADRAWRRLMRTHRFWRG